MATTATRTVLDIITSAARKAQVTGLRDTPEAEVAEEALTELDSMLKGWQNEGYHLWSYTNGSFALDGDPTAAYSIVPVRPLRILSMRYKASSTATEIPMQELTREEYDMLPNKSSTGTPTTFYYDRQREAAKLYVWPKLAAASGTATLEYSYERELEDITATTETLDMPGEWWDAVVYNLAARLMETAPMAQQSPLVPQRAQMLLDKALANDTEGSVFFGCAE